MKKQDFITVLAESLECTKVQATKIYDTFTNILVDDLVNSGETAINGIGKFTLVERAARSVHNPQTRELMQIEGRTAVRFRSAKSLKDTVQGITVA